MADGGVYPLRNKPRRVKPNSAMATALPKSKRAPTDKTALTIRQPNTAGCIAVVQTMGTMGGLDPQECFNKALETVAALKPAAEAKTYTIAELQRLRAACSLTVAGKGHNIASVPCPSACRRTHQTRDGSGTRASPKTY
jgi:hypothetical protein